MRLNPAKCTFRVRLDKFLKFIIFHRGIEANSKKIQAIMKLSPLRIAKEVQSLAKKVAAPKCFVSRSTERCLPFSKPCANLKDFIGMKNVSVPSSSSNNTLLHCHFSRHLFLLPIHLHLVFFLLDFNHQSHCSGGPFSVRHLRLNICYLGMTNLYLDSTSRFGRPFGFSHAGTTKIEPLLALLSVQHSKGYIPLSLPRCTFY